MWSAGLAVLSGRVGTYKQRCGRMLAPPPAWAEQWRSITLMPFVMVAPVTFAVQLKNYILEQFSTAVDMQSFQRTQMFLLFPFPHQFPGRNCSGTLCWGFICISIPHGCIRKRLVGKSSPVPPSSLQRQRASLLPPEDKAEEDGDGSI